MASTPQGQQQQQQHGDLAPGAAPAAPEAAPLALVASTPASSQGQQQQQQQQHGDLAPGAAPAPEAAPPALVASTPASSQGQQQQQHGDPAPAAAVDGMTVALSPQDIGFYSAQPLESFPEAHRLLTELRKRHRNTQNVVFRHDLTHSQELDWRAWLSQRGDAADIVGPGIKSFGFVWLDSRDSNMRERRGDFLVQRTDDVDIRLHPQQKANHHTGFKEACPVWGHWESQWNPATSVSRPQPGLSAPGSRVGHWAQTNYSFCVMASDKTKQKSVFSSIQPQFLQLVVVNSDFLCARPEDSVC